MEILLEWAKSIIFIVVMVLGVVIFWIISKPLLDGYARSLRTGKSMTFQDVKESVMTSFYTVGLIIVMPTLVITAVGVSFTLAQPAMDELSGIVSQYLISIVNGVGGTNNDVYTTSDGAYTYEAPVPVVPQTQNYVPEAPAQSQYDDQVGGGSPNDYVVPVQTPYVVVVTAQPAPANPTPEVYYPPTPFVTPQPPKSLDTGGG